MSDNVYGPYDYKGSIIEQESFAPGYDSPTWPNGFKQGWILLHCRPAHNESV